MLGDDIAAALPGMRAHALSLMIDTCTISRQRLDANGEPILVMDPVTLEETPVWDDLWSGKCRIQRPGVVMVGREPVVGEVEFSVETVHLQLPLEAVGFRKDDRATITATGAISDVDSLGMVLSVRANLHKTHPTKRTLICEEVAS